MYNIWLVFLLVNSKSEWLVKCCSAAHMAVAQLHAHIFEVCVHL